MGADVSVQVALVEDHPLMQEGIRNLLHKTADLRVCAIAGSAEEALQLPAITSADLVLVDISLPKMDGIQLIREFLASRPRLVCVVLSTHTEQSYVTDALAAGARGYVVKGSARELPAAIRSVLGGDIYVSSSLSVSFADAARERQGHRRQPSKKPD